VALADPELGAAQAARYQRMRADLLVHVEAGQRLGHMDPDADPDHLATTVLAFTHGLVVQALFDPHQFTADRQAELVDEFLARLRVS
jgi:hypothetical protein